MAEYVAGKGTTALGIIGTALGGLANAGGVGGILGGTPRNCGDEYVTRYENNLAQENAILKAQVDVDKKLVDVYEAINSKVNGVRDEFHAFEKEQLVYNGVNTATLNCMSQQISQLMALTALRIPAASICPQPMPLYNSWTAPTAEAATGA